MKLLKDLDQNEPLTFACDWILCNGASVSKTKREILAQIANDPRYQSIKLDYCRLRKKSGLAPGKIFYDDQIFGDDIILITEVVFFEKFVEFSWDFCRSIDFSRFYRLSYKSLMKKYPNRLLSQV